MKQLFTSWVKWTWKGLLLLFIMALAGICIVPIVGAWDMIAESRTALTEDGLSGYLFMLGSVITFTIALAIFTRVFCRLYPEFFCGDIHEEVRGVEPIGREEPPSSAPIKASSHED